MVTEYLPGARSMRAGVERLSSGKSICTPFSSTIFSMSPQGDAYNRRTPWPAGTGAVEIGAVAVTVLLAIGPGPGPGRGDGLRSITTATMPRTTTIAAAMPIIIAVLLFFAG